MPGMCKLANSYPSYLVLVTLLSTIKNIHFRLLEVTETIFIKTLLFGIVLLMHTVITNKQVFNATIEYILTTKQFDESLFHS